MRRCGVAVALLALLALTAPAGATVDTIVAGLEDDRVHVVRGAEIDEEAVAEALADDPGVAVVFTGAAPEDGEQGLADEVVLELEDPVHTVLVRSREGVAAASTRYSNSQLDGAIDRSFDALRESPVTGADAFADALPFTGASSSSDDDDRRGSGRFPFGLVFFGIIVVVSLVIRLARRGSGGGGGTWGSGTSGHRSWGSGSSGYRSSGFRSSGFRSSSGRSGGSRSISGRSSRKF